MSNKRRVKVKKVVTHSHSEGVGELLGKLKEFAGLWEGRQRELVTKHNEMAAQLAAQEQLVKKVAEFTAAEIGKTQARLNMYFESIEKALHHHDVNDLAAAEMMKELFGQLTQVDLYLKRIADETKLALSESDIVGIKADATEWYDSVVKSAFTHANETIAKAQDEALEARKAEQAKIALEKEQAAADKTEAERMEAEFIRADRQDRGIAKAPDYTEQESLGLPPEVRVFGMT